MNIYDGFLFMIGATLALVSICVLCWAVMSIFSSTLEKIYAMKPKRMRVLLRSLEMHGRFEDAAFLNECLKKHEDTGKWPKQLYDRINVKTKTKFMITEEGMPKFKKIVKIKMSEVVNA